jgi:hypothetical protein
MIPAKLLKVLRAETKQQGRGRKTKQRQSNLKTLAGSDAMHFVLSKMSPDTISKTQKRHGLGSCELRIFCCPFKMGLDLLQSLSLGFRQKERSSDEVDYGETREPEKHG